MVSLTAATTLDTPFSGDGFNLAGDNFLLEGDDFLLGDPFLVVGDLFAFVEEDFLFDVVTLVKDSSKNCLGIFFLPVDRDLDLLGDFLSVSIVGVSAFSCFALPLDRLLSAEILTGSFRRDLEGLSIFLKTFVLLNVDI